jgi:hypothetical protein
MVLANVNRDSKRKHKPYELEDFMLYRMAADDEEDDSDALERKILAAFNGWMAKDEEWQRS